MGTLNFDIVFQLDVVEPPTACCDLASFDDLEAELLTHVPQVDSILIRRAIVRAAREFCRKTLVLEHAVTVDIEPNVHTYTFECLPEREIVRIKRKSVFVDGCPLRQSSEDKLDLDQGNPRTAIPGICHPWRTATGPRPRAFYQPRPNQIRLVPIPTAAGQLTATLHLMPIPTASGIDEFVFCNWYEILVNGALAELLAIKHKPWTDVAKSGDYRKDFLDGIDEVVAERVSGFESDDYTVGRVRAWP